MKVTSYTAMARTMAAGVIFCALFVAPFVASASKGAESKEGPAMESRFAQFEGIKVHYRTSGKGDEALVFVHGWTCNADFWRLQASAFPGKRVIALDLPGHGKSDKPAVEYTMDYFARSIQAVLRDARVSRAVLVGHSMGTPVVRQFYRLYPQSTLALVIVDGALRPFAPKQQMEAIAAQIRTNYRAMATHMVEGMLAPVKDQNIKAEIRTAMLATPDHVAVSAMMGMMDEKVYEKDPIKVPVLAVMAKSAFWQPDTEQFMRSLAPNLEFHLWGDVSHFLMMDKPQEFNRTLQEFLAKQNLLKK